MIIVIINYHPIAGRSPLYLLETSFLMRFHNISVFCDIALDFFIVI